MTRRRYCKTPQPSPAIEKRWQRIVIKSDIDDSERPETISETVRGGK